MRAGHQGLRIQRRHARAREETRRAPRRASGFQRRASGFPSRASGSGKGARVWFLPAVRDADTEFANPDVQLSYTHTRASKFLRRSSGFLTPSALADIEYANTCASKLSQALLWFSHAFGHADTEYARPDLQLSYTHTRLQVFLGAPLVFLGAPAEPASGLNWPDGPPSKTSAWARVWFSHAVRDADTEFANPDVQLSYTHTRLQVSSGAPLVFSRLRACRH